MVIIRPSISPPVSLSHAVLHRSPSSKFVYTTIGAIDDTIVSDFAYKLSGEDLQVNTMYMN